MSNNTSLYLFSRPLDKETTDVYLEAVGPLYRCYKGLDRGGLRSTSNFTI